MGELTEVRWTRYGKDRLYLKDAAGSDVAWIDLVSGQVVLNQRSYERAVRDIAARHGITSDEPAATASASGDTTGIQVKASIGLTDDVDVPMRLSPPRDDVGASAATDWFDLAANRPGQGARARAEEELASMRARSRVGTWVARTLDVHTDERAWRVGAEGEETIGAKLEKLTRDGWYVLHSVPVGVRGSDIDHVVIGPGGVFTVNSKKHPGKKVRVSQKGIFVDGHRTDYLHKSRHEAERASRLLTSACGFPVQAKAVLVFTTATLVPDVTVTSRPEDVGVLDRMDVPRAFKKADRKLSPDQVEQIYSWARRSTTWTRA